MRGGVTDSELIRKFLHERCSVMKSKVKETKWICPECDFEELLHDSRYEDMTRLSEENADLLFSLSRHHETEELAKSVSYGMVMLSYFERSLQKDTEEGALFWTGKLAGCIETLDRVQFTDDQDKLATERAKLYGTKHLDEIALALETHGTMSQTELGEVLGLRASTLSETLKKVRKTQLVQASSYGKYKVYSLTEEGVRYSAALRRKNKQVPEITALAETAVKFLEDPSTREIFLELLNAKSADSQVAVISLGRRVSFLDLGHQVYTKFEVNRILDVTTNSRMDSLQVLVGTQIEKSSKIPCINAG